MGSTSSPHESMTTLKTCLGDSSSTRRVLGLSRPPSHDRHSTHWHTVKRKNPLAVVWRFLLPLPLLPLPLPLLLLLLGLRLRLRLRGSCFTFGL